VASYTVIYNIVLTNIILSMYNYAGRSAFVIAIAKSKPGLNISLSVTSQPQRKRRDRGRRGFSFQKSFVTDGKSIF
jgi:hypothetical protein